MGLADLLFSTRCGPQAAVLHHPDPGHHRAQGGGGASPRQRSDPKGREAGVHTLPFPLASQLDLGAARVNNKALVLLAKKGADLYANTDGSKIANQTPRVLFQPVGDFIFTGKVSAGFKQAFDGRALIVYGDEVNWAKLLFEFGKTGRAGISSTVAKGGGDDAHHSARDGNGVYLKVARRKDMFVFYTSPDGKNWSMVRSFGMPGAATMKVGFSSQPPAFNQREAALQQSKNWMPCWRIRQCFASWKITGSGGTAMMTRSLFF